MKAQEYLEEYEKQQEIIVGCWETLSKWKDIAYNITGCTEGERVQSSGSKQKMQDAVISYCDIEKDIKQEIAEAREVQKGIIKTIKRLKKDEYYVLHRIYILGNMTFKEVAASKNKSTSWATSKHGTALMNLQKILDAKDKSVKD